MVMIWQILVVMLGKRGRNRRDCIEVVLLLDLDGTGAYVCVYMAGCGLGYPATGWMIKIGDNR